MYLEDIKPGSELTVENIVIRKEEMLDFARKYDPVKIHTDEDFAKLSRFGDLIAPGMLSFLSVWGQYVELDFADDVLRGVAKVTGIAFRNDFNGIMTVTIDVFNQKNEKVLTSVVESIVKRRPKE